MKTIKNKDILNIIKKMVNKKRNKNIFMFVLVGIFVMSFSEGVLATDYYVDQNHPSASDSNLGTEALPWKHAWYGAQQLDAGDTLYIRAGYYYRNTAQRYIPGICPANSGTDASPITIMTYPGDDVYVMGGPTIDTHPSQFTNPAIGVYNHDHIIIDGFKVYGCATLWGSTNSIIRNCEIWGGMDSEFSTCIRLEHATNCRVYNNLVRDNTNTGASEENSVLLMEYDSTNCTIENNEFRDGVSYGIRLKDHPVNITVRYNVIKNCGYGGIGVGNQDMGQNVYIYQNIISDCFDGIYIRTYIDGIKIYNNIFYNSSTGGCWKMLNPQHVEFYNNIVCTNNIFVHPFGSLDCVDYLNYNTYYGAGVWRVAYSTVATNLSAWQTYLDDNGYNTFDDNSINSDPNFVNAGGTNPEDYKLQSGSPALTLGIDRQDYDNDGNTTETIPAGAYITGDEIIGYTDSGAPDTTPPSRSNPQPTGTLTSGTTSTNISLDTDETAECKYSVIANTNYDGMSNVFAMTDSTDHSTDVTDLEDGNSYTYYIRCQDESNNQNPDDFEISFSIASSSTTYSISNFINLVTDWLKSETGLESDVNGDGVVNTRDLGIMMSNWQN